MRNDVSLSSKNCLVQVSTNAVFCVSICFLLLKVTVRSSRCYFYCYLLCQIAIQMDNLTKNYPWIFLHQVYCNNKTLLFLSALAERILFTTYYYSMDWDHVWKLFHPYNYLFSHYFIDFISCIGLRVE